MKKIFALAAIALGMASCSQKMENAATDSQQEIKLTTKITPATRGVNIDEQSTMIKPGQQVGVTITGASASHQNVTWVAGEDGSLENQSNPIFYSDNTATITAYQPYNASWTDVASGSSYNFEIATDQSGVGYSQSDLLYTTTTAQKTTEAVNLNFKHVLAKITVILNNTNGDSLDDAEIKIINTATNVTFSNGTAAVASSEVNDILAGTGAQAAAIIAPQSVDGGTKIIQVVWNGKAFCYSLPATKEFHAGYAYIYRLRINNSPELNLDGSDVEDWNGEENEGDLTETDITPYVTFKAEDEHTIYMTDEVETLEYSIDGDEWCALGIEKVVFGGAKGNLRLRGKNPYGTSQSQESSSYFYCYPNSPVFCSGDIRTLIDYENYNTVDTSHASFEWLFHNCPIVTAPELPSTDLRTYCYANMFSGCNLLLEAPNLPAENLAGNCYSSMFAGCTSLIKAPNLPAQNVPYYSYYCMFSGCSSLREAPNLPATSVEQYGYYKMFSGCTSLECAPIVFSASTIGKKACEAMFSDCSSLSSAPSALPALILQEDCYYQMFKNCTSLTSGPNLPATTLAKNCYNSMFSGCSSLEIAPVINDVTLAPSCYNYMFSGCSNLKYLKILTIASDNNLPYLTSGISSPSGIIVRDRNAQWAEFVITPNGWTLIYIDTETNKYYLDRNCTNECDEYGNAL